MRNIIKYDSLYESEEDEIIKLYKDLVGLGISNNRVIIKVKAKIYDTEVDYKFLFPSLDNSTGEIKDVDIVTALSQENYKIEEENPSKEIDRYTKTRIMNIFGNNYFAKDERNLLFNNLSRCMYYKSIIKIDVFIDLENVISLG